MNNKSFRLMAAGALALALPLAANAESNFTTGGLGAITATARVDFSVVIPKFVFLQVGTGPVFPLMAANGTVDSMTFTVPAASVGNNTPVAATGGDLTNGQVTVRVVGNNGDMTLGATAGLNLLSGADTIPWSEITTAITGGATHPAINGADASFVAPGKVVNINGTWTYAFANTAPRAAGTYTGQVLYTATTP